MPKSYVLKPIMVFRWRSDMSDKTMALLDRVKTFHASNNWRMDDGLLQWQLIKQDIQGLELKEIIEVFEAVMWLSLTSTTSKIYEGKREYPDLLNQCLLKLQHFLAVAFWVKIVIIEVTADDYAKSRMQVTELVGTIPQFSRSAIKTVSNVKNSLINAEDFPIAHFASACLQQPAPDMFF